MDTHRHNGIGSTGLTPHTDRDSMGTHRLYDIDITCLTPHNDIDSMDTQRLYDIASTGLTPHTISDTVQQRMKKKIARGLLNLVKKDLHMQSDSQKSYTTY